VSGEVLVLGAVWALAAGPHGTRESETPDRAILDRPCKRSSGSTCCSRSRSRHPGSARQHSRLIARFGYARTTGHSGLH
jgi:hypothetical protein